MRITQDFVDGHSASKVIEYIVYGEAHAANAWLAAHLVRLNGDALKWRLQRHDTIVIYPSLGTTARNNFTNVPLTLAPVSSTSSCTSFCGRIPAAALVTHEIAKTFIPM